MLTLNSNTTASIEPALDQTEIEQVVQESVDGDVAKAECRSAQQFPRPWKNPIRFTGRVISSTFAFLSLILVLAVLAAIPIVNIFVLGQFLNAEGRVARSGKLRDGFPLIDIAPRIVMIVAGVWCFLLPLRFLASFAADARLIDAGSRADVVLHLATNVAWVLVTVHLVCALARGGTFWCFVRPFKNVFWLWRQLRSGDYFATADTAIQNFISRLEIRSHIWIGLRGFAVGFIWLVVPTFLFAIAREPEGGQILLTIIGAILLAVVLSWTPLLQACFAAEGSVRAGLQLREVRQLYAHAPLSCSLAVIVLYLLALPLYLFKGFLLPAEAMWLVTLIFVATIYPTRILWGWVYHQAEKRRDLGKKAHWSLRWFCGTVTLAALGVFVFIVFFTQFLGEQGKLVLFHHHALLLPAPFQFTINP